MMIESQALTDFLFSDFLIGLRLVAVVHAPENTLALVVMKVAQVARNVEEPESADMECGFRQQVWNLIGK